MKQRIEYRKVKYNKSALHYICERYNFKSISYQSGESNGKQHLKICPECSVPGLYRSPDRALVVPKLAQGLNTNNTILSIMLIRIHDNQCLSAKDEYEEPKGKQNCRDSKVYILFNKDEVNRNFSID
jgi:hypothetical protein